MVVAQEGFNVRALTAIHRCYQDQSRKHFLALALLCAWHFSTFGQAAFAETVDPSKVEAVNVSAIEYSSDHAKPGEKVEVKLKLYIAPNFHAYVEQYKLKLLEAEDFYLSEFEVRPTVKFQDPVTKREKVGTENYAEMVSVLEIPKSASPGAHELKFELTYQACGKDFCLFPKKTVAVAALNVAGAGDDVFKDALARGWLYVLALVFIAGLATSLTPCIYPLIPITLAVLGTTDHSHSRRRAFVVSLFYVLGIATTYSALGVFAAKTGSLFGAMLGSPIVIGFVALLFVAMGLSMYGLFEIQLPHFLTNRLTHGAHKKEKSDLGAYVSGLVAGVVAGPCVGPVLISVLAYVAQSQNMWLGFALLFTFALGFGQLFLVIGTYHNLWHKLPRSGAWMQQVKFLFGTIMIAMAFYYIRPVTPGPLFDGLIATGLIALAIGFGAFRTHGSRVVRSGLRVVFVAGVLFAVKAMLPPGSNLNSTIFGGDTHGSRADQKLPGPEWFHYSEEMLKQAATQGKPVIVDFRADWCLSCTELVEKTFSDSKVIDLGRQFIWLEFDATSSSPELEALRSRYKIGGLPYIAFFNSKGEWLADKTLTGFEDVEAFLKRMKDVLAK